MRVIFCVEHVHMLIEIPPKYSVAQVVGFIKGKNAIAIARNFLGRRQNYTGQGFWARGYYVSTVDRDEVQVRNYIQQQEKEDQRLEQLFKEQGPPLGGACSNRFERFTNSSLRLCRRSMTI